VFKANDTDRISMAILRRIIGKIIAIKLSYFKNINNSNLKADGAVIILTTG